MTSAQHGKNLVKSPKKFQTAHLHKQKMKKQNIHALIGNRRTEVFVKYDTNKSIMTFSEADNFKKIYEGGDMYACLKKIRTDFPQIQFLCKGAKINVRPSSMSSQMSGGMVAYELTLGKRATREDLVHIFDYEDHNLTNDPLEQEAFYKKWIESIVMIEPDPIKTE
ncbi:hypothetical protein [Pseudomonas sp. SDO5271_S396]